MSLELIDKIDQICTFRLALTPTYSYCLAAPPDSGQWFLGSLFTLQEPIFINGRPYSSPEQAATLAGISSDSLYNWTKARVTPYGFPLDIAEHRGHRLIAEADVYAMALVQRDFPLPKGPIPRGKREQMKIAAFRFRGRAAPDYDRQLAPSPRP